MSEGSAVPLPALGHADICFPCRKSILRSCRTHQVQAHHREQNILSRWVLDHLVNNIFMFVEKVRWLRYGDWRKQK